ncbi:hydrogenase iron-sulfur subunit [Desulfatiglans anilini]|uniref:hydrogenase iron-sulfur subunit n=1 Tax=Desulfatiglans anilini TaxID=90728 RepID=UPI000A01CAAC|nr:hydrogenase iron-sulfur subunit [Desulfatiglans anilini]
MSDRLLKGLNLKMNQPENQTLALFYCRQVPGGGEAERRALERRYKEALRLFPIPCSGRLEPVHLLKALEEFADAAYVITCPEGACRYFEGNRRARKRVARTRGILAAIGLEPERVGLITGSPETPRTLAEWVPEIFRQIQHLAPSPVLATAVR